MKTLARQRDRDEILRRLKTLHPECTRRWGRMSVHQMVCHLSDGLRMMTGDMAVALGTRPFRQAFMKCVALYFPAPWPAGIQTSPEIDQELRSTRPADFRTDLATLEALVERLPVESEPVSWPRHPVFGRMSKGAWFRWAYLHADHHLRQFGV